MLDWKTSFKGTRIIVPQELRDRVLQIAHEGHPGIVSMKKRLRSKVWWPGIDKEVERFFQTCHSCQLVGRPQPPEPMKSTELPQGPWQHVSADLMTPSTVCPDLETIKKPFFLKSIPLILLLLAML